MKSVLHKKSVVLAGLFFGVCFPNSIVFGKTIPDPIQQEVSAKHRSLIPIGDYLIDIFEDSRGNLWFGTLQRGVARFDGKILRYFSEKDGLAGNLVADIEEDAKGFMWFATNNGLSRFNGKDFKNYNASDGLVHNRVSQIMIDRQGTIWLGTWGGVSQFDGESFQTFALPKPKIVLKDYQDTQEWVTEILEDQEGNIWIARDGYGVCKYDGTGFTSLTKQDGLASNNVMEIAQDLKGNMWFGSRITEKDHPDPKKRSGMGGLSMFDGQKIRSYPDLPGLHHSEMYAVYLDPSGHLWMGSNGHGLYRFDGDQFKLYADVAGQELPLNKLGIMAIHRDKKGILWVGLTGGLYRLDGSTLIPVGQSGPWP